MTGNTRCNLAGRDLNRQYKNVVKEAFPPVYQTKMMIKVGIKYRNNFSNNKSIAEDHGGGINWNVLWFPRSLSQVQHLHVWLWEQEAQRQVLEGLIWLLMLWLTLITLTIQEQIYPLMLHKNASDKFSFESSKFTIQRSKESTGRVVFWNMGIMNSFTLEVTNINHVYYEIISTLSG